jgi:hypothetical protein
MAGDPGAGRVPTRPTTVSASAQELVEGTNTRVPVDKELLKAAELAKVIGTPEVEGRIASAITMTPWRRPSSVARVRPGWQPRQP